MIVTLNLDRSVCSTEYDNQWNNMVWLPILNLILSSISLALMVMYFYEMTKVFQKMRNEYQFSIKAKEEQQKLEAVLKKDQESRR